MKIRAGVVYEVKYKNKGTFLIAVKFSNKNYTTAIVLESDPTFSGTLNVMPKGSDVLLKNVFCEFKMIQHKINRFHHCADRGVFVLLKDMGDETGIFGKETNPGDKEFSVIKKNICVYAYDEMVSVKVNQKGDF